MTTAAEIPIPVADAAPKRRNEAWTVLHRLSGKPAAVISSGIILLVVLCALFPGLIAPHDPFQQSLALRLRPPAFMERGVPGYWLGTDHLGRDTLSRIIYGARVTLIVSVFAVLVSGAVGIWLGLVAGFFGGRADAIILRLIDIQLAFPVVLLVIALVAVVGPSLTNLIVLMGLSAWPRFARIVRGSVLSVRNLEFVEAARAVGASKLRIMLRHILPNILSAIIVYASFELARMILLEATLSFLGLGVQPPDPTWGGMINDGKKYLTLSTAVSLFPGLAIAAVILAFNILGDELRDALDPQLSQD
jgi:ABC-type dipeptide/oligopeptide/nickel transport system permease subunit